MVLPIAEQNPCRTLYALLLLIELLPFEQYLLPYYQVKSKGIPLSRGNGACNPFCKIHLTIYKF